MSAPLPSAPEFEPLRPARWFLPFLWGWLMGAGVLLAVRALGQQVLATPCEGRTILALAVPLLLGPGGLAFLATNWRTPRRAALGLGLVAASLFPALFLGAQDIGRLRSQGCAGGYIVISQPGNAAKSISALTIHAGETVELRGRIGGYTAQTNPGLFQLSAQTSHPGLSLKVPQAGLPVGTTFPIQVTASVETPINTFNGSVTATQTRDGKTFTANGALQFDVRPRSKP